MKRFIIIANWKMNKTLYEARNSYLDVVDNVKKGSLADKIDISIASSFPFIYSLYTSESSYKVSLAAQNCSSEAFGAFTGEVSAPMIKSVGAKYVIIGHSEPRRYLNETDDIINKKISIAIEYGLIPILCLGEPLEIRQSGNHIDYVISQLSVALNGLSGENIKDLIIAYEPIWAIGTNNSASNLDIQNMHCAIRAWLHNKYGNVFCYNIRIIYGGSVNNTNISSLSKENDIDGFLVGGASLSSNSFVNLIKLLLDAEVTDRCL